MMQSAEFLKFFRLLAMVLALCMSAAAPGQEDVAEESIAIDSSNENDESPDVEEHADGGDEENLQDENLQAQKPNYQLIEEQEDDWVEPQSELQANQAELRRLFLLYRDALGSKAYLEADTLAKRIIELSIRINGIDSSESAKALTNLAIAQHNNRDFEAALQNFTASVDIIERIDNRLSAELINPLRGLGATYAAMGRADLARTSFQRAIHVSHVNDGPHNKGQVQTLQSMAELYISAGEIEDAVDIQENIYSIQARKIDPASLDILPALQTQAQWQHRLRIYHRERVSWRRIINIIEKHHGKQALQLIEPLINLGGSYLFVTPVEFEFAHATSTSSGESYLRRANRIAESNPDSDWQTVEKTLLALGDYYIISGRPNRASKIYVETWDLLSEDEERLRHRRDNLEHLNVLQKVFPPKYYNSEREEDGQPAPDNFESGSVSFSYSVSPTGRIHQIQHLETQPPEIVDIRSTVARSLRHLVYRPVLENRKMVDSRDNIFTHEFFYRPSDIPELVEESDIATEQEPTN